MRPPDIIATELARGLQRYQDELTNLRKQNCVQVRNFCRDGCTLSEILRRAPRLRKFDDQLAVAVAAQWTLDTIGDIAPEERTIAEVLLRAVVDFETARRKHDRLVEKLDPQPFANVLTEISRRLPPTERDDQPALEKVLEIIACDNGVEGMTQELRQHGFAPGPVLTKVYGRHLPAMHALEARLEEAGQQRRDCADKLENLRSGHLPAASARTKMAQEGPSATATGAVPAHRAPKPPPWEKLPETERAANFAAEKKAMRSRLKTLKARHRSLERILKDAPKPAADTLDDTRACALVGLWIAQTIGPVADDEKEIVARLVDHARRHEVLRRAREILVREIDPRTLADLLDAHDARQRASTYIAMAEALLARPDSIAGLRAWMQKKGIPAQPALEAIFGDRLSDIEDLEETLVDPVIERALASAELEYMRLSRGDLAYPVKQVRTPADAERPSFQEILVRDLDRCVKVEEDGRIRRRSRRELVIEAALKTAPRSSRIFDLLRDMHARGPRHRTKDEKILDFRPFRIAMVKSQIEELKEEREARARSKTDGKPMRRGDVDQD